LCRRSAFRVGSCLSTSPPSANANVHNFLLVITLSNCISLGGTRNLRFKAASVGFHFQLVCAEMSGCVGKFDPSMSSSPPHSITRWTRKISKQNTTISCPPRVAVAVVWVYCPWPHRSKPQAGAAGNHVQMSAGLLRVAVHSGNA